MITNLADKQSYQGNGSNTNFAIPFTIVVSDQAEVGVILRDVTVPSAPVDTPQVFGALQNYTLTGANPPGTPFNTTVVMNVAPTSNQVVVIYRKMPFTQLLNMLTNNFDYSNLNVVHDRIVAMIQVLNEVINRAPLLAQASQQTQPNFIPEPPGGSVLGFNLGAWVWYSVTSVTNAIATLTGDVTSSGGVNAVTTIAAGAVTLAKMANLAANSLIGNNSGSPAAPQALTQAQATALLNAMVGDSGSGGTKGLVPAAPVGSAALGQFLSAAGTFAFPALAYYSGYMPIATNWNTTSASPVDPIAGGAASNALTRRNGNITVAAESASGNNLPGIVFTPASATAVYEVEAKFTAGNDGGASANVYFLTDGTNIYDTCGYQAPDIAGAAGAYDYDGEILKGFIATGNTAPVTIKIQMCTNSSTGYLRSDNSGLGLRPSIEWKVKRIA